MKLHHRFGFAHYLQHRPHVHGADDAPAPWLGGLGGGVGVQEEEDEHRDREFKYDLCVSNYAFSELMNQTI